MSASNLNNIMKFHCMNRSTLITTQRDVITKLTCLVQTDLDDSNFTISPEICESKRRSNIIKTF